MIELNLPMPPSVNVIWRRGKNRRTGKPCVYLDAKYKAWKREADGVFLQQKRGLKPIKGHFTASIVLDDTMRAGDADNRAKAVLDFLQRVELIENDSLADHVETRWGKAEGCRVMVRGVE